MLTIRKKASSFNDWHLSILHVLSWGVWSCLCIFMSHFQILWEQTGIFPVTQNSKECNGQYCFSDKRKPFSFSWIPFISEGMILGNLSLYNNLIYKVSSIILISGFAQAFRLKSKLILFLMWSSFFSSPQALEHIPKYPHLHPVPWLAFHSFCTYTKWRQHRWKTWLLIWEHVHTSTFMWQEGQKPTLKKWLVHFSYRNASIASWLPPVLPVDEIHSSP